MKKSTFYSFALICAILCMTSCTVSKGYDYKAHQKRGNNPALQKCYKKHNKW